MATNGFDRKYSLVVYGMAIVLIIVGLGNSTLRDDRSQPSPESVAFLAEELRASLDSSSHSPMSSSKAEPTDSVSADLRVTLTGVSGNNPWQLLLGKYDYRLSSLTLNVFAQLTFVLLGLSILRPREEAGRSPHVVGIEETRVPFVDWHIKTWHLLFLIPIALAILWFHFGILLFELIRLRVMAFEIAEECGGGALAEALDTSFQDGLFLDAWFVTHRPDQTGLRVENLWYFRSLMYLFPATLLGLTHATIFLLMRALVRARQPVWKEKPAFFLFVKKLNLVQVCAWTTLFALVASHLVFGGLPFFVSDDPETKGHPTFVTGWIGMVVFASYYAFSKAFNFGESDEAPQDIARRRRRSRVRGRSRRNARLGAPTD